MPDKYRQTRLNAFQKPSKPVDNQNGLAGLKGAQSRFLIMVGSAVEIDTRSGRARRGFERALRGVADVKNRIAR